MKQLIAIDYAVIAAYMVASFAIGNHYRRRAGSSLDEYFLSGRKTPWWLIAFSMAATNYSIDYPLAICKLVAKNGVPVVFSRSSPWPSSSWAGFTCGVNCRRESRLTGLRPKPRPKTI